MSDWYSFVVDAGSLSDSWLTPGRVTRALDRGARISSDALGTITPLDRGRVEVQVPASLAATIVTPLPLRLDGELLTLRRSDDIAGPTEIHLDGTFEGQMPSPGATSIAFAAALGESYGAEDLGLTLVGADRFVAELPPLSGSNLPDSLTVGEATLSLSGLGKKKQRNLTAPEILADAARAARARIDGGEVLAGLAKAALGEAARDLLDWAPWDTELSDAVGRLVARRMNPPRPAGLPQAVDGPGMRRALERWDHDDCVAAAAELLTLPNPQTDEATTAVVMEVLLAAHDDRAVRLLERASASSQRALWRFRWQLGELDGRDEEALEEALETIRGAEAEAGTARDEHLSEALREAAALCIGDSSAQGAAWMVPCLGGRRVANVAVALMRRPALADELEAALRWLSEAEALVPGRAQGGLEGLISAAEDADKQGRYDEGGDRLERALARSGGREDLANVLRARASVLLQPRWAQRANQVVGELTDSAVESESSFDLGTTTAPTLEAFTDSVTAPAPPERAWEDILRVIAETDVLQDPVHLAVAEASGAVARAAQAHLALGDVMQAHRLREHLSDDERAELRRRLLEQTPSDEFALAQEPALLAQAWALKDDAGPNPGVAFAWELRVRAALGMSRAAGEANQDKPDAESAEAAALAHAEAQAEDPHSTASRLAAAADLVSASRSEAAATVVAALFKHAERVEDRRHLIEISSRILRESSPPPAFVGAVGRLLAISGGESARQLTADAMLDAVVESPLMAYPLHTTLHGAAAEAEGLSDHRRLRLLEAWLGIWRATATPPAVDAVRKIVRHTPLLLALAAFRLAGVEDPVRAAVDFDRRYPSRTTTAAELADALLTAASA